MFEAIRKHSKIAMLVMFLLIIPSFVLVGIDSNYFSSSSPVVARVDGSDITQAEWDNAHRVESDRIRAQQPGIDGATLDSPQSRYVTLERLVRDRVLQAAANKMHLQPSDARLARELQEIPQIAALRRPDGTLDAEAYRQLAANQGLTPEGFEASMRRQLAVNEVMGAVMGTSFATTAQAQATLKPLFQEREIRVATFLPKDYEANVKVLESDLEAYYQANVGAFKQSEQADIEYVVLNLDAVRAGIKLSDEDLRSYYKENVQQYASKEERRISHILVAVAKDAPTAERDAAKVKAQSLLEQVRKAPDSFAEVAKKESQDPGSAAQGGDLGFITRGAMVKPFEDAAFGMEQGSISDVIQTDFGFHILKMVEVKKPVVPTFEAKRAEIETQLSEQMAQRKFAEVAETFTNTVYEQSDSLDPVAKKLNLKIQVAKAVVRDPQAQSGPVLSSPKLLSALFSPDAIEQKRNTEAIEVGANELVSARITKYASARTLSLEEAKDKVRVEFIADRSAQLAKKAGEAMLADWSEGKSPKEGSISALMVVSRQEPKALPAAVIEKAMSADVSSLPMWSGVDSGALGYRVVEVAKVVESKKLPESVEGQRVQQYTQYWTTAEALAYYEVLKQRFKVQFKVPKPDAVQAGA